MKAFNRDRIEGCGREGHIKVRTPIQILRLDLNGVCVGAAAEDSEVPTSRYVLLEDGRTKSQGIRMKQMLTRDLHCQQLFMSGCSNRLHDGVSTDGLIETHDLFRILRDQGPRDLETGQAGGAELYELILGSACGVRITYPSTREFHIEEAMQGCGTALIDDVHICVSSEVADSVLRKICSSIPDHVYIRNRNTSTTPRRKHTQISGGGRPSEAGSVTGKRIDLDHITVDIKELAHPALNCERVQVICA